MHEDVERGWLATGGQWIGAARSRTQHSESKHMGAARDCAFTRAEVDRATKQQHIPVGSRPDSAVASSRRGMESVGKAGREEEDAETQKVTRERDEIRGGGGEGGREGGREIT